MKAAIRQRALELGFDDCRITSAAPPERGPHLTNWLSSQKHGEMSWLARNAPKRLDPQLVLPGATSVITLAASYLRPTPATIAPTSKSASGIIARYAQYPDYHDLLAAPLKALTTFINEMGGPEVRSLWYVDTGPILERELAERAGLGFVGKHTNLISRRLGNWFFIAEILTTARIEPDGAEKNRCGSCTRCLNACPTKAITAPFQLDARRCVSYLTIELKGAIPVELRPLIGNRIYGCDDCLAVCPWNRFAQSGRLMASQHRQDIDQPDLVALLRLGDAEFKERFAGTPILRTKRRGLLRNVCVALGNVGNEKALPDLTRAKADPEALIAEHAEWAIEQIVQRSQPVRLSTEEG